MADDTSYASRLVDEDRLRAYLASEFGEPDAFSVTWHREGHSNETLFVTWGERRLVLRRPPAGETADTAHDVHREYRVLSALHETDVPVPEPVLFCDDQSVIESEFYLMERVDGDVVRLTEPDRFADPRRRHEVGTALVDSLADVHGLDYAAVGLEGFGRPEGYLRRQVERWKQQLDWATTRTRRPDGLPNREEIEAWLERNCPRETDHTLVHGDYKLDNVVLAPGTPPELNAVIDWEMSALGSPLADLGWLLLFWHDDPGERPPIPDLMPGFIVSDGYPTRRDLIERYETRTGRTFDHSTFYQVFATYKLAGVCEMFYARHISGDSDDPLYAAMDEGTPSLMASASDAITGRRTW